MAPRSAARDLAPSRTTARRIEVRGVVQGVGFRPFVWRLAERFEIHGWVRNGGGAVEILAEGPADVLDRFCSALQAEAPPLARVEDVRWVQAEPTGVLDFEVDRSVEVAAGDRLVPADSATCESCLRELLDPTDRRYRYPFINCTDCGPRFTIIESLPYDRERTSMRAFPMCPECAREYADPADRRFHAEPVACPACGPRLELRDRAGHRRKVDPLEEAVRLLLAGRIVALKGLGGFHLACDATNEKAVAELRRRKVRPDKPFAVMVADLAAVHEWFEPTEVEEEALACRRAPIVLVTDQGLLAPSVAPGHRRQGVMLPSTPLHHLLLRDVARPLVMTSGNRADEPICTGNDEAMQRLAGIADAFVLHDRAIVARYDDSVVRAWRGGPVVLRRARSFAPTPLELGESVMPILGTGAELYGAFCLAAGTRAYLSQHVGDLDTEEAMAAYHDALERSQTLFGVQPEAVAHDLHPDFATTRFAESTELPRVPVQHHHAHVAAVMAEHRLTGRVIGVAFDGFGLGTDGSAWGGEFLVGDPSSMDRAAHLRPVPLPGGDAAVRHPWRMALAYAHDAGVLEPALSLLVQKGREVDVALKQIDPGVGTGVTTSVGRLFDAVAALAGICDLATYEGHPAIWLEQVSEHGATREYPFEVSADVGGLVLDPRPLVTAIVKDLARRRPPGEVAGRFHRTLTAATLEVCRALRGIYGIERVCLAGGVFQNDLLTSDLVARLETVGFEVFLPREAPVGDGGIALGQVWVAAAQVAR